MKVYFLCTLCWCAASLSVPPVFSSFHYLLESRLSMNREVVQGCKSLCVSIWVFDALLLYVVVVCQRLFKSSSSMRCYHVCKHWKFSTLVGVWDMAWEKYIVSFIGLVTYFMVSYGIGLNGSLLRKLCFKEVVLCLLWVWQHVHYWCNYKCYGGGIFFMALTI